MKKRLLILVFLALTISGVKADEASQAAATTNQAIPALAPVTESSAPQFQNGDKICFVGDSITQAGGYHFNILLFYATRFPDRRIEGYNCGVNGDSSGGLLVLKRYQWDVLDEHHPNIVTLMYGMNDVGRLYYGKDKIGPDWDNKRKWPLLGYPKQMHQLSEIFTQAGCKIIYLTPSIYDQTGNQASENNFGVNDALAVCGEDCRKLAAEFHGGLVDFNDPMGRINAEQQQKDPSFTLIGPDRIHPLATGQLVMAYLFLTAQKVPAIVSDLSIDAATSGVVRQDNGAVTNVKPENGGLTFIAKENALPFPLSADGLKKVEALVPFTNDLNREILTVANLPAGYYQVSIDGQKVQDCTADDLKNGINLATNVDTPQYKQALKVLDLARRSRQLENLTRIFQAVKGAVIQAKVSLDDETAARKVLQDQLDAARKTNPKALPHFEIYLKYTWAEWAKMKADAAALWDQVYIANQPVPHTFEIKKSDSNL